MFTVCIARKSGFLNLCIILFCLTVFVVPGRLYAFTITETTTSIGVAETIQGTDSRTRNHKGKKSRTSKKNQAGAKDIDSRLKEMLENINQQQYPDKKSTLGTNRLLQTAKKTLDASDSKATCQYFMLQAWNAYFAGNKKEVALKVSLKAYKTNPANNDARLTHVALALINGQKPVVINPKKTKQPQKKPPQNQHMGQPGFGPMGMMGPGGMQGPARSVSRATSGEILLLDDDALNDKVLASTIEPLKFDCLNSTSFSYDHQDSVLCAMFWRIGLKDASSVADPNDKKKKKNSKTPARHQGFAGQGGPMGFGRNTNNRSGNNQNDPLFAPMDAFGKLFANNIDNPAIKFVAVNTDSSKNARSGVMKKLMENPWPWAQVAAGEAANSKNLKLPEAFADIDINKSFLVIADPEGSVRYAGPAEGFLAPLILNDLAPGPASPASQGTAAKPTSRPEPKKPSATKTPPAVEPPAAAPKKIISQDDDYFDPQAEKLLEHGRGFVKIGRLTSYKKGIDLCRRVINEYPDTKYEQQAREILRNVPERHHKRYKITNEELGL
jgi:hypothetical protein